MVEVPCTQRDDATLPDPPAIISLVPQDQQERLAAESLQAEHAQAAKERARMGLVRLFVRWRHAVAAPPFTAVRRLSPPFTAVHRLSPPFAAALPRSQEYFAREQDFTQEQCEHLRMCIDVNLQVIAATTIDGSL